MAYFKCVAKYFTFELKKYKEDEFDNLKILKSSDLQYDPETHWTKVAI